MLTSFINSLRFFTRLPIASSDSMSSFTGVVAWLPMVGIVIGIILSPLMFVLSAYFPTQVSGVLLCLVWVALTGGLHLDGVCDCGDGFFVAASQERRLEIMKDSRLGSYSAISLFFVLAIKIAALSFLCSKITFDINGFYQAFSICVPTACFARGMIFIALRVKSARPNGMGAIGTKDILYKHFIINAILICIISIYFGIHCFIALCIAIIATLLFIRYSIKCIGGVTGDVFGCLIEFIECVILISYTCTLLN